MPANSEPSPAAGRIFAIIICIDRYQARNGLLDLNGCINDGRQFEDFLAKLKVPKSHICWCTDENATYQGIMRLLKVAASEDLMTLFPNESDFRKGDLIILFYAGHGGRSRSTAPSRWKNPEGHVTDDGEFELICPHDIDTKGTDQTRVHGIPDFVFGNLLDTITAKHGGNVLSILDCCHSGGIARDSEGKKIVVRGIDCEPIDPDALKKLRAEYPKPVSLRGASRSASNSQLSLSFVLLAGCRKHEYSGESHVDGVTKGIFTTALVDALSGLQSYNISYATIVERSARAMAAKTNAQTPECVGDGNRILFKLDTAKGDPSFELAKAPGELYIILKAGEVQGIFKGATFNVQTRDHDGDALLGTLEVVGPTGDKGSSYAKPSFDPELDPKKLWAFLHRFPYTQAPLKVGLGAGVGAFHPEKNTAVSETSSDVADVVLSQNGHSWILERKEPRIVRECSPQITLPIHVQVPHLNHVLAGIAHFNYHLTRTNRFRSSGDIAIEMYKVVPENDVFRLRDGNNLIKGGVADLVFDTYENANYGFTLKNNSATDWYPYLFHFDPADYSIYQIYPVPKQPNYGRSLAGLSFPIGHGESALKPTKLFLRPDEKNAKGFLKLFLSKTKIHMDFIGQRSPFILKFRRHFNSWHDDDTAWMEKMVTVEITKEREEGKRA